MMYCNIYVKLIMDHSFNNLLLYSGIFNNLQNIIFNTNIQYWHIKNLRAIGLLKYILKHPYIGTINEMMCYNAYI